MLGFTVVCGIATVLMSSAGCPTSDSFSRHCGSQVCRARSIGLRQRLTLSQNIRWVVITALDIVTEVILLVLPVYLVWHLQMKPSYKMRVIAAFCFRILYISTTIGAG